MILTTRRRLGHKQYKRLKRSYGFARGLAGSIVAVQVWEMSKLVLGFANDPPRYVLVHALLAVTGLFIYFRARQEAEQIERIAPCRGRMDPRHLESEP